MASSCSSRPLPKQLSSKDEIDGQHTGCRQFLGNDFADFKLWLHLDHELADFKLWLQNILEHHRDQSSEQVREQIDSLKTATNDFFYAACKSNGEYSRDFSFVSPKSQRSVLRPSNCADPAPAMEDEHIESEKTHTKSEISQEFMTRLKNTVTGIREVDHLSITTSVSPWKRSRTFQEESSEKLDMYMGIFLCIYLLIVFAELTFAGLEIQAALGLSSNYRPWKDSDVVFDAVDHIVNVIFIFEMLIRIYLMRRDYYKHFTNVFDAVVVGATSVQMYILDPLSVAFVGGNIMLLRVLRFGRTVRVLRLVQIFKNFHELRVLLETFTAGFRALIWSMVFLCVLMTISSLFLCYSLRDAFLDEQLDHEFRVWLFNHYGNGFRSTYTFFQATLSGCWPNYFSPLITEISPWYVVFVFIYINVVVFALLRIITALFLKQTMQAAANDVERTMNELRRNRQAYINKLRKVFEAVDLSGDGELNIAEFGLMLDNPDVHMWLQMLDMELHDCESLFNILDENDSGKVSYDEFLTGVMRLKGTARAMDVVMMCRGLETVTDYTLRIKENIEELSKRVK